jgi:hypothetical protein
VIIASTIASNGGTTSEGIRYATAPTTTTALIWMQIVRTASPGELPTARDVVAMGSAPLGRMLVVARVDARRGPGVGGRALVRRLQQ